MKKISKKQIKQLDKGEVTVRELFPEEFEKLKSGWYFAICGDVKGYLCYFENPSESLKADYYIMHNAFVYDGSFSKIERIATEEEVFKALEKEAINRGFKEGSKTRGLMFEKEISTLTEGFIFSSKINELRANCKGDFFIKRLIFSNGKWAQLIETITKSEAEKQLGKLIID